MAAILVLTAIIVFASLVALPVVFPDALERLFGKKKRLVMLRKAAEEAMEKIRARLGIGKSEAGSLSLAGDEELGGGLSLTKSPGNFEDENPTGPESEHGSPEFQ